jgi:starvation-inducible DNA-binding protein
MEALIEKLRLLQSSTFIYYTKAHGYHWNVEGILFEQFHSMFGDIYEDAFNSVDSFAEWVRIFGEKAVFDVQSNLANSNVRYDLGPEDSNPVQMLQSLLASNEQLISDLNEAFDIATASRQQGVANFFADRIAAHEKWRWKMTASLKSIVNN